ncbi:sensor histidine kinase [Desulfoferrobacter suflitae]|uniref:sensor histidine kinase n=1 Tax=Desulfoferrobacter suflitae TaxID=2865782 RepID=UPI0021648B66|nr:HAMP domain-containing histidine kinase [Desulfoferrobacter suflitae]MCK8601783.1 HAMP domain-containing histidine kinase [Desulfoferrobacter suflitae]
MSDDHVSPFDNVRFSLRLKIFLIAMIPAGILLFAILQNYLHLNSLGQSAQLILSENYKSIQAAHEIRAHIDKAQNDILSLLFLHRQGPGAASDSARRILDLLGICRANITEPEEEPIIAALHATHRRYQALVERLSGLPRPGRQTESYAIYYNFIALIGEFNAALNQLVAINEKAMERADLRTQEFAGHALKFSMVLLISAILFAVILSYLLSLKISRPLTSLARGIADIREGSGDYPRFVVTTQDEIGYLTSEFNRLLDRLKHYDQLSADELMAEKLKVRQAEEAKARFIADLSHQLKTPMTSLAMSINILADKLQGVFEARYERLLQTAKEDCTRLSTLITELVDAARLDAIGKPPSKELLRLDEIVGECIKVLQPQADEKNIRLETELQPDLPPVTIDSLRFPWVLTNLLGNAIRYSQRGDKVVLCASKVGDRCYFQCIDAGTGIDEKYLPRIFDRFSQFSNRKSRDTIGLGLAIVKEIIQQHGGDIRVESRVGRGTTFTFWIPFGTEQSDDQSAGSGR